VLDQADRKKYELHNEMEINQKFHKFASSHSEVLLVGRVPPECLTLIPFTGTVPDSDESSDIDSTKNKITIMSSQSVAYIK
jgi:hypothetical protein